HTHTHSDTHTHTHTHTQTHTHIHTQTHTHTHGHGTVQTKSLYVCEEAGEGTLGPSGPPCCPIGVMMTDRAISRGRFFSAERVRATPPPLCCNAFLMEHSQTHSLTHTHKVRPQQACVSSNGNNRNNGRCATTKDHLLQYTLWTHTPPSSER